MAAKTIRVRCSESARLLARDGFGNLIPGRYLGRNRRGEVIAEGVLVEQTSDILRALARGDLERLSEPPVTELRQIEFTARVAEETDR